MAMLKNWKLSWMQVAIVAIVAAVFVSTYWMDDAMRAELRRDLGYAWAAAATIFGPLVRKKISEELASPKGDS
jgi:hypothetical protein